MHLGAREQRDRFAKVVQLHLANDCRLVHDDPCDALWRSMTIGRETYARTGVFLADSNARVRGKNRHQWMHTTHSPQEHQVHVVIFCDAKRKVFSTVPQKRAPQMYTNSEAFVISFFRATEATALTSVQGGVVRDPM